MYQQTLLIWIHCTLDMEISDSAVINIAQLCTHLVCQNRYFPKSCIDSSLRGQVLCYNDTDRYAILRLNETVKRQCEQHSDQHYKVVLEQLPCRAHLLMVYQRLFSVIHFTMCLPSCETIWWDCSHY